MHNETQDIATNSHPYTTLTPDCVLDAVESLGFLCDGRIFPLNSYENRVYQVGIEEQTPVIVKFYRPERWSTDQILEEHQFLFELKELEIPVVCPWQNTQGQSLHTFNQFSFAVFPRQGGHAPELDNMDNLVILGRMLGRIHQVGRIKPFTHRPTIDIASFGQASYQYLLNSDLLPYELKTAYETLGRDLLESLEKQWPKQGIEIQRIHGDCHPGNILWRDDLPHFVDFDDCRAGPCIQDLWMLLSGDRHQQIQQLDEILSGYEEFSSFNLAELRMIEPLRTLRIMHYSAWLARRWTDPAFPKAFPWFNTARYWSEHILELREQLAALQEPPLTLYS
ncbi:serine/threonine protein kinase [Zooshikella sp. RANM57]|uniref:serine/threonine protein kinase n=1 Tax=Zooshikella sp. RANM57 TaxID=3425863 RepID=UPI003D6DC5A0